MQSTLTNSKVGPAARRGWTVALAVAVVLAIGVGVSTQINTQEARAKIERQNAEEIVMENRRVCATFGIAPETQAFQTCADALAQVRQGEAERRKRFAGIFG